MSRRAFTLIELLVVIAILAALVAILLPSLAGARAAGRDAVCLATLRGLMQGVHAYAAAERDHVVPSYNMRGTSVGAQNPLDGWGPILDRGGYVRGSDDETRNAFVCPNLRDQVALAEGAQTGSDPRNPQGYMDWPTVLTLSAAYPRPLPERGFPRLIRVGYWINAENPIGVPRAFVPGRHFSGSVGYGPSPSGVFIELQRLSDFREPARLIAFADGVYAGNQEIPRYGQRNSRIGYRHSRGSGAQCNIAFADGHATPIESDAFPRKYVPNVAGLTVSAVRLENLGAGPTVYANPARDVPPVGE